MTIPAHPSSIFCGPYSTVCSACVADRDTAAESRSRQLDVDSIEAWLESRPYMIFSEWDITRPDRRRLAAEWLYRTMVDWAEWAKVGW